MNGDTALEIKNLSTEYFIAGRGVKILDDVSITLKRSGSLAIIGESGSGKTTLALAAMKLIMPWEGSITAGSVSLISSDGKITDVLSAGDDDIGRIRGGKISLIPQDAGAALNPAMRIYPQIAEAVKARRTGNERRNLVENALAKVHLPPSILERFPHQISGGQKQRALIAAALVNDAGVIIADEPTSGLDAAVADGILRALYEIRKSSNVSMIVITHDIRAAARLCEDAVIMYAGRVCETAALKSIIHRPKHPYTSGLMAALPDIEKISGEIKPMEGNPPDLTKLPAGCAFAPRCPRKMKVCETEKPPLFPTEIGRAACFLYGARSAK